MLTKDKKMRRADAQTFLGRSVAHAMKDFILLSRKRPLPFGLFTATASEPLPSFSIYYEHLLSQRSRPPLGTIEVSNVAIVGPIKDPNHRDRLSIHETSMEGLSNPTPSIIDGLLH